MQPAWTVIWRKKTICSGFRTSMKLIPRVINTGFRSEIKLKHNVLRILHWLIPQPPSSTSKHAILRDELHNPSQAMAVLLSGSKHSAHSDSFFFFLQYNYWLLGNFTHTKNVFWSFSWPHSSSYLFLEPPLIIHSHIHVLSFSFLNNLSLYFPCTMIVG